MATIFTMYGGGGRDIRIENKRFASTKERRKDRGGDTLKGPRVDGAKERGD